jgi:hypothetical protein
LAADELVPDRTRTPFGGYYFEVGRGVQLRLVRLPEVEECNGELSVRMEIDADDQAALDAWCAATDGNTLLVVDGRAIAGGRVTFHIENSIDFRIDTIGGMSPVKVAAEFERMKFSGDCAPVPEWNAMVLAIALVYLSAASFGLR